MQSVKERRFWLGGMALAVGIGMIQGSSGAEERESPAGLPVVGQAAAAGALTIHGDPPDPTNVSDELKKIYQHIDTNFDAHLERLQRWVRIPSVSNTVEGKPWIWESAKFIRDVIVEELGCEAEIYDPGIGDWGAPGHPVVYGRCDVGAEKTLLDYSMGDAMPIFRPEVWERPPFAGELVEKPPFRQVLLGRAAGNHKGKDMAEINALISIKAVTGTLPVNVVFVSEHDEERMDIGLRTFLTDHKDLFQDVDAAFVHGRTVTPDGRGIVSGQSIGCVVFDLQTGPAPVGNWHSEQPMWQHVKMLDEVLGEDAPIWNELEKGVQAPSAEEEAYLRREAELTGGNPSFEVLMKRRTKLRVSITGLWGGNMAAGYAGHYRSPVAHSKIDIRFPPTVDGNELLERVRSELDRRGYEDVKMNVVGYVPWSWTNAETEVAQALLRMYEQFNVSYNQPPNGDFMGANATYYGPNALFAREPLQLPVVMGGLGGLMQGAHIDNEFIVIKGDGEKQYGFAGAMKGFTTFLYNYAGKNPSATSSSRGAR